MTLLTNLTVVAVWIIVLVVAGYLIAIATKLARTLRHLRALAGGLEGIEENTRPLRQFLADVNSGASQLLGALRRIDEHLQGVALMLRM